MCISVAYIRFCAALAAQGIGRANLSFRSPLQPFFSWYALVVFATVTIFNGFDSIAGGFKWQSFITCYIGFPIFFGLFTFWKVLKRTKWREAAEADIQTGKAEIDAVEWPPRVPRNVLEKIWFWIA